MEFKWREITLNTLLQPFHHWVTQVLMTPLLQIAQKTFVCIYFIFKSPGGRSVFNDLAFLPNALQSDRSDHAAAIHLPHDLGLSQSVSTFRARPDGLWRTLTHAPKLRTMGGSDRCFFICGYKSSGLTAPELYDSI